MIMNEGKKHIEMRIPILACIFCLCMAAPVSAMTRHIDLEADLDNIPEHNAGEAFLPDYVLMDDDEGQISVDMEAGPEVTASPIVPYSLRIRIHSDNGSLDEDLVIRGNGIRSTSVEYVSEDNEEAEGRLLVYPFYRLPAPQPSADLSGGFVSWPEVPYAGKYEYLISYTDKNGDTKQKHGTTKQTSVSIASEISASASGQFGFAVRALATEEEGYTEAVIRDGTAYWDDMNWADKYRVRIAFTSLGGKSAKQEKTVTGTSLDVQSYIDSSADHAVKVTVRAVPRSNDHAYYNIALSEFGFAGNEAVDTSDLEVDDPWEFLADYSAVSDGSSYASYVPTGASSGVTGVNGGAAGGGTWKRITWKWQYLMNGVPYSSGWIRIGDAWYYFDPDGFMHTGWLTDTDGKQYYLETKVGSGQGRMVTGTREIDGVRCSFDESGARIS